MAVGTDDETLQRFSDLRRGVNMPSKSLDAHDRVRGPEMREVKRIRVMGQSILVEWYDSQYLRPRRVVIPLTAIDTRNLVSVDDLDAGIAYGFEWAKHISIQCEKFANRLEIELNSRGIWTLDDLLTYKTTEALAALRAAYSFDLGELLDLARYHKHNAK